MKKHVLLIWLALVGITAHAQAPANYYNSANGLTGSELRQALHDIIDNHTSIKYKEIWGAFPDTDPRTDYSDKVWDIYSDIPGGTPKLFTFGDSQCGSYSHEGDCYNREHSWPQSWFNSATTPSSDLHHIFPTDGFVNNQRSNFPYGEVSNPTYASHNGSKLGPCTVSGYSGTVFEPIDEYKGDIARAYFYMSTRYYGEDDTWGTSDMTNKSEILPWAMTMLLAWNDADPVSQKEIDRNNVIYSDYQHNRNPFIDNPNYAHMIWDASWSGGSYAITLGSVNHGTISAPATASTGTIVSITAIPEEGYVVSNFIVTKTGDNSTTVPVSSNGTFTMPDFAVTVSATFASNNTYYTITYATGLSHGSIVTGASTARSGASVNLTATPDNGYELYSWYVYKTNDMTTMVYTGSGSSFIMPAYPVTVTASFVQPFSYNYVKVTSEPDDWKGDYLIVFEAGSKAFNGSLSSLDGANNNVSVTIINDNTIASNNTTDAYRFIITKSGNNYNIKSASGFYIGQTTDANGLKSSQTTAYTNTISYGDNCVNIIGSGGPYLRYNNTANNYRFRYYTSGTYTGQQPIQLYKKTGTVSAPTHAVHFHNNDGSGNMADQSVEEMTATALSLNTFTREGFEFDGWNTVANGTGTYYVDGASVMLLSDLDLYAQWSPLFAINCATNLEGGTISASTSQAVEGSTITLTASPASGYQLDSWTVTDSDDNTVAVTGNQFEMPASNVTVSATFAYVGAPFAQHYYLVTSTDQLVAGRTYLIVNTQYNKALGTTQNENNRSAVDVEINSNSNTIEAISNTVCQLTLGGSTGKWTFKDGNNGYLYAASSSKNWLRTQSPNNSNGEWTIEIENGIATITSIGTYTHNLLQYNNGATIFSCYNAAQQNVSLFIRSELDTITQNTTLTKLFAFDKHVITDGTTLTVTGTATCTDPSLLVIEDGGQLIHSTPGVQATFKKAIADYNSNSNSDSDGWFTIATPFTNADPSQAANGSYDLYAYNEAGPLEWTNYKAQPGTFAMTSTAGFLYAHSPATTLRMTGTLNIASFSEEVTLSYSNPIESIRGFNLLGNPTAHNINFTTNGNVSGGYYYLDNNSTWVFFDGNTVPPGRGFLVKANAENTTVTLNPGSSKGNEKDATNPMSLQIDVDGEKAYVRLTESVAMPLLDFHGRHSSVYLNRDGKPYIMVPRDDAESIDLSYEPHREGQHTLSVNLDQLKFDYLHLIDHLTGADIDLLLQPSYTFTARTTDYASRFKLVFNPNILDDLDQDFAFIDGDGNLIVNGDGYLQIFDVLGRQRFAQQLSTLHSPLSTPPGVYVLRLTTPEKVKIQKIIIN